jgi:hypothetical protein
VKPNPPPPVRGNLLSTSQIAERFPTAFPLHDNLDSEAEEKEIGEKEKDEKDDEDDGDLEVFLFHI